MAIMSDLAVAFAMDCDQRGLSYEEGLAEAETLCEEIIWAAEERGGIGDGEAIDSREE